jgi:anaphase-promoting complex subunit 2
MDELIGGVGAVDRTAALKALITWVDLGVLKEDEENQFRLLEITEEAAPPPRMGSLQNIPPSRLFAS